MVLATTSD